MRFGFLDGLRGWAAVIVLFHHVFVDGLPASVLPGLHVVEEDLEWA